MDASTPSWRHGENPAPISRKWTRQLPRKTRFRTAIPYIGFLPGEFSIPLITESRIFVGTSSGTAIALSAESGSTEWEMEISEDPVSCQAAQNGEIVVFASESGEAVGFDASTGEEKWRRTLGAPAGGSIASISDRVFVPDLHGGLHALSAATGEILWSITGREPEGLIVRGFGGPVADEDEKRLFWGRWDGTVQAVNVKTGAVLWKENYGGGAGARFQGTDIGLAVQGDFLYVSRFGGDTFKLRLSDGLAVWRSEQLYAAAGPAADESRVYVPLEAGGLAALDADVGGQLQGWGKEIEPDWGTWSHPKWIGGFLVGVTLNRRDLLPSRGRVIAINPVEGTLAWSAAIMEGSSPGIAVGHNLLATLSERAVLQVWELRPEGRSQDGDAASEGR